MKKVKATDFNVNIERGIFIDIDSYRFILDEAYPYARVELVTDGETNEFLDEFECNCINHEDLKVAAINWIFNNVEIVERV